MNNYDSPAVDYYKNAEDPRATSETTLHDLIDAIRSNEFADHVAEVRALIQAGNKPAADILKKQLPAVSLSGTVKGRRKAAVAENRFMHSGYLQIDLDGKDNIGWTVEEMREVLKADPRIAVGFVTPSGEGIKGVARIPADAVTHKAAFRAAEAHFKSLNLTIDPATKDPVRLCFVSHDPDAWIRMEGTEMFVPAEIPEVLELGEDEDIAPTSRPVREKRPAKAHTSPTTGGLVIRGGNRAEMTLEDLAEMVKCIPRLDYGDWLSFINGAWLEFGTAATPIMAAAWPEENPGEYEAKFAARFTDKNVTIATCIFLAQRHGSYRPPVTARMISLNITRELAAQIDEAVASGSFLTAMENDHRGLAQAYASIRFGKRCFSHDEKIWRVYQDGIWSRDDTGTSLNDLQHSLTPMLVESANSAIRKLDPEKDKGRIQHLKKRALCLYNLPTARAVLENATILPEFSSVRGDFDQKPHLLAIENGVLDFSGGGDLIDHSPSHMLTVMAPLKLDTDAECPGFDQFLFDVSCGDLELVQFHLESLAIALTGFTSFDFVWFHYGNGSNGKSTFTQTLAPFFGDGIFRAFDSGLLVGDGKTASDDYKRASLEGARLALGDELPDGKKLRTEEMKKLIGGDLINARNPYEKPRDFKPTHKTWLCGNFKPEITSMDDGTWRRVMLVPWNAKFTGAGPSRDDRVAQHIAESSGILNRLMCAWANVKLNGLTIPPAVRAAGEGYKKAADQIQQFADQCLASMPGFHVPLAEVRKSYDIWCANEGEKSTATRNRKMADELRRIGFQTRIGSGNKTLIEDTIIQAAPKDDG